MNAKWPAAVAGVLAVLVLAPAAGSDKGVYAQNADRVDGIHASVTPRAGQLVPLTRSGKLPASVVPTVTGPQGPKGDPGEPAHHFFAAVNADGTIAASSGVDLQAPGGTGKSSGDTGIYLVLFKQDIHGCVAVANLAKSPYGTPAGSIPVGYATLSFSSYSQVNVRTFNSAGVPVDSPFWLAVLC